MRRATIASRPNLLVYRANPGGAAPKLPQRGLRANVRNYRTAGGLVALRPLREILPGEAITLGQSEAPPNALGLS